MDKQTEKISAIVENVEKVIIGKKGAIELVVVSLLAKGHVLIEDMPGVGKTSLVSALAKSVDCSFRRIQFTPDIMPSDITGFSMFNQKSGEFEYRPGSVMSQFVLADEINRTSPKTQSSLLEVMEENQVTVDGNIYKVPAPFIVFATQNPVEYLGTYPLPEAQLDRFFMKVTLGYPEKSQEIEILERHKSESPLGKLEKKATAQDILNMQKEVESVHVEYSVAEYITNISRKTREISQLSLGASPRATLCLYKACQSYAYLKGRDYCVPDDAAALAVPVLSHRIAISQEAKLKRITADMVINNLLNEIKAPVV